MMNLAITVEPLIGCNIKDLISDSIELAKKLDCCITFSANNVWLNITSKSNVIDEYNHYMKYLKIKN